MKKVILFLFLIVNILIFFNVREVFFEKDEIEMTNFSAGNYWMLVIIDNLHNESITVETSHLIFDKIDDLTLSHNITVTKGDFAENRIDNFVPAI